MLHQEKLVIKSTDLAIKANPPQTEKGMIDAHAFALIIAGLGPFDKIFSGRTARTNDAASTVCMHNGWDWQTTEYLNQNSSRENGVTVAYPGREHEFYAEWYRMAQDFLWLLDEYYKQYETFDEPDPIGVRRPYMCTLAFTSRANLSCLWGLANGIVNLDAIKEFARGNEIKKNSIYVFERNTIEPDVPLRLLQML